MSNAIAMLKMEESTFNAKILSKKMTVTPVNLPLDDIDKQETINRNNQVKRFFETRYCNNSKWFQVKTVLYFKIVWLCFKLLLEIVFLLGKLSYLHRVSLKNHHFFLVFCRGKCCWLICFRTYSSTKGNFIHKSK